MVRLYNKECEYAIRALVELAAPARKGRRTARAVCRRAGIPEAFARKAVQRLSQRGLLKAVRGPGGGYALAVEPRAVSVLDIITAIEGEGALEQCVMGLPACTDQRSCPMHGVWTSARRVLLDRLRSTTLRDLIGASEQSRAAGPEQRRGR
ncbi:MAG TPA: Rrf2 family transcriptional regulator [bacterium]